MGDALLAPVFCRRYCRRSPVGSVASQISTRKQHPSHFLKDTRHWLGLDPPLVIVAGEPCAFGRPANFPTIARRVSRVDCFCIRIATVAPPRSGLLQYQNLQCYGSVMGRFKSQALTTILAFPRCATHFPSCHPLRSHSIRTIHFETVLGTAVGARREPSNQREFFRHYAACRFVK